MVTTRHKFYVLTPIMFTFGLLLLYIPIITLIIYSFRGRSSDSFDFTLDAYVHLFQNEKILSSLESSISIALISASISTILGGLASLAMERGKPYAPKLTQSLTLAPLILPEVVFGLGLLVWFVFLRVSLGMISLILAHITFSVSYVLLTVRGRVKLLDPAIDDAARDLGATPLQLFFKIQLPLMAPALLAGWMMAFTLSFDDFLISFFTSGPETVTLPIQLYSIIKFGISREVFAMATCIFAASFLSASIVSKFSSKDSLV
jgi:spermidine/putrescine transport system permease protein